MNRRWFVTTALQAFLACSSVLPSNAQAGFRKFVEPREKAFTALVPTGWLTRGGIERWGPDHAGAVNATEAKVDFTVASDKAGTVMAHFMPDVQFYDMTGSPAAGMYRPGMQCNGCIVMPLMPVDQYLVRVVLPITNPRATDVRLLGSRRIPEIEKGCDQLRALLKITLPMTYRAGIVAVDYTEGAVRYRQVMFCITEDMSRMGLGMWKSRSTMLFRAPVARFGKMLPIFQKVQASVEVSPRWLLGEMKAATERTGEVAGTFAHSRELDAQITRSRRDTGEKVNRNMQSLLTEVR